MHRLKTALCWMAAVLVACVATAQERLLMPTPAGPFPSSAQTFGPPMGLQQPGIVQGPTEPLQAEGVDAPPGQRQIVDGRYVGTGRNTHTTQDQQTLAEMEACARMKQCPIFFVTLEALSLDLDQPSQRAVVLNQTNDAVVLTTHSTDLGMETGPRLRFAYLTEENATFEMSYFGIYNWDSRATALGGVGILTLPGPFGPITDDYHDSNLMRITYTSRINSFDVDMSWTEKGSSLSTILGLRFIRLDELYNINTLHGTDSSAYEIRTRNQLFGAQGGARWRGQRGRWEFVSTVLFGGYGNQAFQKTFVTDANRTVIRRDQLGERTQPAFSGEFIFEGVYPLRSGLFLHVGYNLLYLTGVARAPDQLDFSATMASGKEVWFRRGALMHGPSFGIEARW